MSEFSDDEIDPRDLDIQALIDEHATYHHTLTRILKWFRKHGYNDWSMAGDASVMVAGCGEELIDALSDAGFEIADDALVIHRERVEERDE